MFLLKFNSFFTSKIINSKCGEKMINRTCFLLNISKEYPKVYEAVNEAII